MLARGTPAQNSCEISALNARAPALTPQTAIPKVGTTVFNIHTCRPSLGRTPGGATGPGRSGAPGQAAVEARRDEPGVFDESGRARERWWSRARLLRRGRQALGGRSVGYVSHRRVSRGGPLHHGRASHRSL